jgi:hypothetical protein
LTRHQRAQAHNSTHYRRQLSFMYWLCSKQNCLLCAYEHDFGDNYIISIVKTGLTTKKYVIVLSVLNLVSDFVIPFFCKNWRNAKTIKSIKFFQVGQRIQQIQPLGLWLLWQRVRLLVCAQLLPLLHGRREQRRGAKMLSLRPRLRRGMVVLQVMNLTDLRWAKFDPQIRFISVALDVACLPLSRPCV